MYIYELQGWPALHWNEKSLLKPLAAVRHRQGLLIGKMEALGLKPRSEAVLDTLTQDVVKSSEIEGELLNRDQVRSSIARRLGIEISAIAPADRNIDGVVDMMLDATQNYQAPLTRTRVLLWHTTLFPSRKSGMTPIRTGEWRDDSKGPMQVVSGPIGRERIHFEAPSATRLEAEMQTFLAWFEEETSIDPVLKAGLAHFWFVTLHPFDDGNGRIARAIADLALARSEHSAQRFYSMSAQIRLDRKAYYEKLESCQKGDLDVTEWLIWFLGCLDRAIGTSAETLAAIMAKARFWDRHSGVTLNARQIIILNRMLDGFDGKLTTTKWAAICKCSQDTALRDIDDLIRRKILVKEDSGGRSTSYSVYTA